MRVLIVLGSVLSLSCTPSLNWREVRHPEGLWSAAFPDKPVQVTRTLTVPRPDGQELRGVVVSLWAVRIGEQAFSVGLAQASGVSASVLREALLRARLLNIGVSTGPADLWADQTLDQLGQMRLDPQGPAVPARLMMRSEVHAEQVLEAIVAGPVQGFDSHAAETFLQSVRLARP